MRRLLVLASAILLAGPAAADSPLAFADITLSAGTGGPTASGKTGGHGVMFADVDADGLPDLYTTMIFNVPMPDLFLRNLGRGRFADEGVRRGIADHDGGSHGACWADLDADGDYDLVNGTTSPHPEFPNFIDLFRNDGAGAFEDVTPPGLRARRELTRGLLCFDMDGDGDLDLFGVTNYQGSADPRDERNEVYRNDGEFRFAPVEAGDLSTCLAGQGAIDTDFDGDGDIDVFAANRTGPVNILRNQGDGTFERVSPGSLGIEDRAADGVTTADIDNDGDLDLLLAGGDDRAALYANRGDGTFTLRRRFSDFDGYMGGFADLDCDGDLDLVFAGDDLVYVNDGRGTFRAGPPIPVAGINDPRGIAFSDIDGDGDPDFAVGVKRSRNWLIRNDAPNRNHWLKVKLVSPRGQAGAFGAKVSVYPAGKAGEGPLLGFREARSNGGYLGQDDPILHFGLGAHRRVDVAVAFPGGARVTHRGVAADQTIVVRGTEAFSADRIGTQWRPYSEWSLENPSWSGNPFDLEATATFRHAESGEEHTTGMFHDGGNAWRFRFTGTHAGRWTFSTTSADPELHGRRGTVTITAHPDPGVHGFLTSFGDKWGWGGTNQAFVPQLLMYKSDPKLLRDPAAIEVDMRVFFDGHGFNGFHVPTIGGRWFDIESERVDRRHENPDPRTFEALEILITRVHAAGGFVHIWAWGDQQRRQTPLELRGGPDGEVDARLGRYLAARLGPMPGWTMGYGFDLQEWAAIPGRVNLVTSWHARMEQAMGWRHFLGGRMGPTVRPGAEDHAGPAKLNAGLGYMSYQHHRPTYAIYVGSLEATRGRPVMSEDRFRIRVPPRYPDKDYDEEMTRRGLYHSTLAGGVANIWGNNHPGGWGPGGTSRPYPHPEWIRTYATFFRERFREDMVRAPGLSKAFCLTRPTKSLSQNLLV